MLCFISCSFSLFLFILIMILLLQVAGYFLKAMMILLMGLLFSFLYVANDTYEQFNSATVLTNTVICWNSWRHLPRMKSPTGPAIWLNSSSVWVLAVDVVYSELGSQNVRPEFSNLLIAGRRKIICNQ